MSPQIPDDVLSRIARAQRVSEGELDALKLALKQRKSKDIAQQLGISEAATRKRLGEVYKKFGIKGKGPGKLVSLKQQLKEEAGKNRAPIEQDPAGKKLKKALSGLGLITHEDGLRPTLSITTAVSSEIPENPGLKTEYYWNDAPTLTLFEGRRNALKGLKQWILQLAAGPKLLAICGIGGIGKTSLAVRLAEELDGYFDRVVWLSACASPDPAELLEALLEMLPPRSDEPSDGLLSGRSLAMNVSASAPVSKKVKNLIERLKFRLTQQRCLVIIDGFETVFTHSSTDLRSQVSAPTFEVNRKQQASRYREDLAAYGDLLRAFQGPMEEPTDEGPSLDSNVSCLLLTSREKPRELLCLPVDNRLSYLYTLDGLLDHEAARMLSRFHLQGQPADYKQLIDRYYGHPMALRLAASAIKDMFYGRIKDFLDQEISVFDDLRSILKTQFKRLSPSEVEVMYWLSINHVPSTLESLQADIVSEDNKKNLLYTLQSLEHRFLIEVEQVNGASYRLHPIVSEYVLSRFIRAVFSDLIRGDLSFFNSYALMKADADELCRQFQKNAIIRPILERLRNYWKSLVQVDKYLNQKLDEFRDDNPYRLGYAGGNFVNLMVEFSQGKLVHKDFSTLMIWQAYLQGAELRSVRFNRCELNRSVFTETLGDVVTVAFTGASDMGDRDMGDRDTGSNPKAQPLLGCGDTNGVVHLWKTSASGQATQAMGQKCAEWVAHHGCVRSLIFMPKRARLATGGDDSYLKLWQLPAFDQQLNASPRLLWQREASDWVHTIAVSPDGLMIASGGEKTLSLYDANSGQNICQFTKQSRVRSLAFSPNGQWLASCGDDDTIRLWYVASFRDSLTDAFRGGPRDSLKGSLRDSAERIDLQPSAELIGHTGPVRSVQFSPAGALLISGSDDGNVRIWSATTFACQQVLHQSSDRIRSIAISPDGQLLASGGDDCQVRLWDLQTYQLLAVLPTQHSRIGSVVFQQRGRQLLLSAGGDKQTLMIWQVYTSGPESRPFEDRFSEDGLSEDGPSADRLSVDRPLVDTLLADELAAETSFSVTARSLRTYRGYTDGLRALSFLGAQHIISGGDSRDLSVWAVSGERKATLSLHQGRILAIALDAQNTRIASASDDHTVRLWDANTGQCLKTFVEHTSWVRTVAFSPGGRFLASSGDDCTLRIWNTTSGFCVKVLEDTTHWIHSVGFDPSNSRYLISGGDDQIVRRWDRKDGKCRFLAVHDRRICAVAYHPSAPLVASGSDDSTVILWDMEKNEQCDRLTQPELGIKAVAFSPNGRYLAAGGEDQIVYLWDLSTPERECFRLSPRSFSSSVGGIRAIAFSPDSDSLITGGLDATIRMADLKLLTSPTPPLLRPLIQPERPYEKTEIEGVKGLSHLQVSNLVTLGAINRKQPLF